MRKKIGYFKSIKLACEYGKLKGYSFSSLEKYYHCRNFEIIPIDVTAIEKGAKIITSLTEVE